MKRALIEKMTAKYFLSSHPCPKIEGEMIIFKPMKVDQTLGKDIIVYRDYSLRKRVETTPKTSYVEDALKSNLNKKKSKANRESMEEKKEAEPVPNLQCLEIDINEPLSGEEWNNFTEVILETQAIGWFQVLPVGQKSSMPYQFNMLHVLS
jgi:ssDNA-binding Zn-finger/Zn-ribbon topoisomerase 1